MQAERARRARQAQASLFRRPVALAVVAGMAAGHQVFPGGLARAGAGHNVVERELIRAESALAILARVAVAHQDVLARERPRLHGDAAVFEQADHARDADRLVSKLFSAASSHGCRFTISAKLSSFELIRRRAC